MEDRDLFEARVGTVLHGKWTLERLIGVGGMAAVYVARHKIGRLDAIKILHPDVARDAELRARFEQEAHAANRLGHPGAVEIRDIDKTEDGTPFMVMELLQGEPLSDRAQRLGSIPMAELLRITDELLDVLAAAHAAGVIHRDIKLDNLFILRDGRLKVLDFGIARMREGAPKTLYTRVGEALGTLTYMAPEQVHGSGIDARADLFAVGATLFRLITNQRLHEAQSERELLVKMATQPAPPLEWVAPSTPSAICLVVNRALAFDRDRRYPDAQTMQQDVRAVARGEPPPYAAHRLASGDAPNTYPAGAGPRAAASAAPYDRPGPTHASAKSAAWETSRAPRAPSRAPAASGRPTILIPLLVGAGFLLVGCVAGLWYALADSAEPAGHGARAAPTQSPASRKKQQKPTPQPLEEDEDDDEASEGDVE